MVPVMDELDLERMKEALHRSIVIAVALAAHRRPEAGGLHQLAVIRRGILNAPIGMMDQADAWPLCRDRHLQGRQWQAGAQMIRHRPADNPAAVQIHDGGQIEPAPIGLDVGDIGEPDLVRSGGAEAAVEQIRCGRQVVTAVGGPHPAWPRHDGPDTVTPHQSLDATTARSPALSLPLHMDKRAAITPAGVAVDPPDVVDEGTISDRSSALRARAPGIIAGRRDAEHVAQERHRIIGAAIFDEAESHVRVPAKKTAGLASAGMACNAKPSNLARRRRLARTRLRY